MSETPMPTLTRWHRFISLFGIKTSWQWCAVGDAMSREPGFKPSLEECRNGKPLIAGGFLWVFPFGDDRKACEEFCQECNEIAKAQA